MGSACLPSNTMVEHSFVLSPWQIYCGLFVMFWASQCYFSSFWMTILCCLKFGLIAELVTDYMYRRGRYKNVDTVGNKNKLNCLTEMAMLEASQRTPMGRITPQSEPEKESNEKRMM